MAELEIYSRIEPIGGMTGVSEPPDTEAPAPPDEAQAQEMFNRIALTFGARK